MSDTIPYVVRQGDHLRSIAFSRGLDPDAVWQGDANSTLRKQRPNPDLLAPGDVLFLPVVEREWIAVGYAGKPAGSAEGGVRAKPEILPPAVPPVASKSSTSNTRAPGFKASTCMATVA